MKRLPSGLLLISFAVCIAHAGWARTAKFDFDTCAPRLTTGRSTPLDQTCNRVRGHISSSHDGLQGGGYSVQDQNTTGWVLHLFSGNYLVPNGLDPGSLSINFNTSLARIRFDFATADFNQSENPTTIQMDAYLNSKKVGSKQARGTYGSDTMPMGTLVFNSPKGKAFNRIVIWIPPQPLGSSDVLVDNVTVVTK